MRHLFESRFPDLKQEIGRLLKTNPDFREICEDYKKVSGMLAEKQLMAAGCNSGLKMQDLKNLQQELEREMHRFIAEHSK